MKRFRPLNIRDTLWLSFGLTIASTVLGASALYSYQLYRSVRYAQGLRVQAIAETYAAQLAPLVAMGQCSRLAALIEDLPWHPSTCLLVVLNVHGEPIAFRGDNRSFKKYLALNKGDTEQALTGSWNIPGDPELSLPAMHLAAVEACVTGSTEPVGTLVYAARQPSDSNITSQQVWSYFIRLAVIAGICMLLGVFWLQQQVLKPLALLAHRSKIRTRATLAHAILADRHDEIGALARTLTDMDVDLEEWRQRAAKLERNVTCRVANETQKITRELRKAQKQIWADPLTKLGNRRLFDDKFADIFRAQFKASQDLSLVMLDLDNFKIMNDTLGHEAGDKLLIFVGELLSQGLREQDLAIRLGGDEFLLILPSVSVQSAQAVAVRTIRMFAQHSKLLPVDPQPTMSAGIVSLYEHQPTTAEIMFQSADQALYDAKSAGKSCARIYRATYQNALNR